MHTFLLLGILLRSPGESEPFPPGLEGRWRLGQIVIGGGGSSRRHCPHGRGLCGGGDNAGSGGRPELVFEGV
jgi:hypothetical protein